MTIPVMPSADEPHAVMSKQKWPAAYQKKDSPFDALLKRVESLESDMRVADRIITELRLEISEFADLTERLKALEASNRIKATTIALLVQSVTQEASYEKLKESLEKQISK